MSASASRGQLTMATRQLMSRWEQTRQSWRDQKAADFEAAYLQEITETLGSALRTLEDLDQLLARIHADCE